MNLHKVLLGALLIKPAACPLCPAGTPAGLFARSIATSVAALPACGRAGGRWTLWKPALVTRSSGPAFQECAQACEGECIAINRERVESWTRLVQEQAALTRFQSLALQAGSTATTFADLPELYSQMGEALTLDQAERTLSPLGHW